MDALFLCPEGGVMREVMIGLGLLMAALSLVIVYSALIVASECDDLEEEYWRKKKDEQKEG